MKVDSEIIDRIRFDSFLGDKLVGDGKVYHVARLLTANSSKLMEILKSPLKTNSGQVIDLKTAISQIDLSSLPEEIRGKAQEKSARAICFRAARQTEELGIDPSKLTVKNCTLDIAFSLEKKAYGWGSGIGPQAIAILCVITFNFLIHHQGKKPEEIPLLNGCNPFQERIDAEREASKGNARDKLLESGRNDDISLGEIILRQRRRQESSMEFMI